MRRWPAIGLALAVLWVFVRGVTLELTLLLEEFIIGLLVGVPLAFLLRRFYNPDLPLVGALRSAPPMAVYAALFVRELVTANLDVAYRVLHPSLPIDPTVIELPLRVESDLAVTTIANSITLTPGTLTMDYDAERNVLYVHSIYGRDRESIVAPIRHWEDYALRIFAEPRGPEDPVPAPQDGPGGESNGE